MAQKQTVTCGCNGKYTGPHKLYDASQGCIHQHPKIAGLQKAIEIAKYHRDKYGDRAVPAWKLACNEIIISCSATISRLERGEQEDPTTQV